MPRPGQAQFESFFRLLRYLTQKPVCNIIERTHVRVQEAELVKQAQGGSVDAIGKLYDGHHEQIFRYVWSRVRHKEVAEDLTGEIFTRMVSHLPDYQPQQAPFRAWLYQIARNLIVDHFRRNGNPTAVPLQRVELTAGSNPDEVIDQHLSLQKVQEALERIDAEQRDVILMRFVLGLSLQEVADTLDKSVGAVKSIQHRGLKTVRATLKVLEL